MKRQANAGPSVLVVDDHDLFRHGLRTLLEEQGVDVAGEATDGREAVAAVIESPPDVVLMDLNMPAMTGVEAAREIGRIAPLTRIVVLTVSDRDEDVMDAVLAGACGYLLKDSSVSDLMRGIKAAAAGESLISPYIAGRVLERVRALATRPGEPHTREPSLSARELEVLKLVACGRNNAEIARELTISAKTVKNHVSNILVKLQIENRVQAAVYAVRSGIA